MEDFKETYDLRIINTQNTIEKFCQNNDQDQGELLDKNLFESEVDRLILELAFRRILWNFIENEVSFSDISRFFDSCLSFSSSYIGDPSLFLILLEDYLDVCSIDCLWNGINYLQSHQEALSRDISSSKGHGLIVLRICNELIRKLSKSSDNMLSGQILLFLSVLFPSGERSGVNLRGDFNIENVTSIQQPVELASASTTYSFSSIQENIKSTSRLLPYDFYHDFWKLQFFILHPLQTLLPENWNKFTSTIEVTLSIFESFRGIVGISDNGLECPKYLSFQNLFSLQISDQQFRLNFVLQLIIFLNNLLNNTESPLDSNKENWTIPILKRALVIVSNLPNGKQCYKLVRWLQKNEKNWIQWKSRSCPKFELQEFVDRIVPTKNIPIVRDPQVKGSPELTRLWGSSEIDNFDVLDFDSFVSPLKEQLDPDSCIEPEYRSSRDPVFLWKSVRMLEKTVKGYTLGAVKSSEDLESFVNSQI